MVVAQTKIMKNLRRYLIENEALHKDRLKKLLVLLKNYIAQIKSYF